VAGLEYGLRSALKLGETPITPSLMMVYLVFVCMFVRASAAPLAAIAVGLLMDLLREMTRESTGGGVVAVGPSVLGCLLAASFALNMRGIVYQKNVPTLVVLSGVGAALGFMTTAFVLVLRSKYDDLVLAGDHQFVLALGSALYTAVAAIPLGFLLLAIRRLFGFERDTRTGFRME
ncbi:MAG: hypothetical protein AAGB34_01210, partial [Planctomycetota bacterium]